MSASWIIPLVIGLVVLIAAWKCAGQASRLPVATRIFAALAFVPVALFCVYGFLAALEPGDFHIIWQIGYAVVFLASISAIGRLALVRPEMVSTQ